MILWIAIGVMTVVAVGLLLPALLRRPAAPPPRADYDVRVYRDQLAEIERDMERGIVDQEQAAAARIEIGRRLLAADSAAQKAGDTAPPPAPKRVAAAALTVLVPAMAVSLYVLLGRPDMVTSPNPHNLTGTAADQHNMESLVAQLARKLKDRPEDVTGWTLYARSLAGMGRYKEAEPVFARALALDPNNTELLSLYAETQIFAAGGIVTPAARGTLETVLAREPGEPRARFYMGLAEKQAGKSDAAMQRWLTLEAESPPDAPWRPPLNAQIAQLAKEQKIDDAALAKMRAAAAAKAGTTVRPAAPAGTTTQPAAPGGMMAERSAAPGPTAEDVAAASAMSAGDRSAMIRTRVARLASRLENEPADVDGWLRLARAYSVLKEPVKARDAMARAAAQRPNDASVQGAYLDAMVNASAHGTTVPPEIGQQAEKVLKLDPNQGTALWYGGMAKSAAGDKAGARALWTRLLGRLDPASKQHADVKRRLDALGAP